MFSYLYSYQDLILLRTEVIAFCQENLSKGSFPELPLQNDVMSLDVLNNCEAKTHVIQQQP